MGVSFGISFLTEQGEASAPAFTSETDLHVGAGTATGILRAMEIHTDSEDWPCGSLPIWEALGRLTFAVENCAYDTRYVVGVGDVEWYTRGKVERLRDLVQQAANFQSLIANPLGLSWG